MATNVIVGDFHEFELVQHSVNFREFFFKVLTYGEDTGYIINVHLYGGINVPVGSNIQLSTQDCNKLFMFAVKQFKGACYF